MNDQVNTQEDTTTATNVKTPSDFECYLGNVGLNLEGHSRCLTALRDDHPIFGTLATPFYLYYSVLYAPIAALFTGPELYKQYKMESANNENVDLDIKADWVGWEARLNRNTGVESTQIHRQAPKPDTLKKIGIGTLITAGLLILGMLSKRQSDD